MWRTLAILVLTGLLLVSVAGNAVLFRQASASSAEAERERSRALADERERAALQARLDTLTAKPAAPAPSATRLPAATRVPPPGAPAAPVPSRTPVAAGTPVPAAGDTPDMTLLRGIEQQVQAIRGLRAKRDVPVEFLAQDGLRQYLQRSFERDYLPRERESDQKLLQMLGLIRPDQSVVQIELGLLDEQVLGIYDEDEKKMYVVASAAQFGPEAQDTYAHEFTHALQDQYYELLKIEPKHPVNSDQAAAVHAVIEGDAVLVQQLWAQQYLSAQQRATLGQGGDSSKLDQAPAILKTDLLFPYVDGFAFVLRAFKNGGRYAGVDELFKNLPESTQQILHPEQYAAHKHPVTVDLPDLTPRLGAGWRRIDSNVMGELDLRNLLEQYGDRGSADRAAAGWAGDRWELLEQGDKPAVVLRLAFDNDAAASQVFSVYGDGLKRRFPDAQVEDTSAVRQALATSEAATDLRLKGSQVLAVIAFDRASADALVAAVGGF